MKDKGAFRQFITDMYTKYPEIFPHQMKEGFNFRGFTASSRKLDGFRMRRITLSE